MAKMVAIDFHPDARKLRQFGVIALVVFGVLAVCAHQEAWLFASGLGGSRLLVAASLLCIGTVAGLLSAVYPKGNRFLFITLSVVAFPIGFVLSYVILGVLFFAVFAPAGVLLRLMGRDPMQRRFERDRSSYWSEARTKRDNASYFKQF